MLSGTPPVLAVFLVNTFHPVTAPMGNHLTPRLSVLFLLVFVASQSSAQAPPYDNPPAVTPPYYRVRYEASHEPGRLVYPVNYTIWIPPKVKRLRGVIVHQHGCGEGSCKSGQTGAFDLHWQALATAHDCALLAPSYEQPEGADCQMWCDPRNGSADAFQKSLVDLGKESGHQELSEVPWALWGHSGGGHWAGGMLMLFPERVAAVWLRSGVPLFEQIEGRNIKPHQLPDAALQVPVMCNLGTKEGVSDKSGRFAGVWPANEAFFKRVRSAGGLVGIAIDPKTSHECGNQRYLAIPWFDACLKTRLASDLEGELIPMDRESGWLAAFETDKDFVSPAVPAAEFAGNKEMAFWLPSEQVARAWYQYVTSAEVQDATAPPAPNNVQFEKGRLTWSAQADLQSGIEFFVIEKGGKRVATVPDKTKNQFGRPLFQGLQYSDTPIVPLVQMEFEIVGAGDESPSEYTVRSVNTVGLSSEASHLEK